MSGAPTARLDRLLANLGYGSRREVQALIAAGGVVISGARVHDGGVKVAIEADLPDRLTVRGAPVDPPAPLTLMLHKPLGLVCSHCEPGRSVYELLPRRWRARDPVLSSIGRLDADTTGLLLITDDGPLLHRIISPRAQVTKQYHVTLARPLAGNEAAVFAAGGLMLDSEVSPLAPATLEPLTDRTAHLTLTEGRYHQVRRMFAAVGNHVTDLHRNRVGLLELPADLAPGAFRILTTAQRQALFEF